MKVDVATLMDARGHQHQEKQSAQIERCVNRHYEATMDLWRNYWDDAAQKGHEYEDPTSRLLQQTMDHYQ